MPPRRADANPLVSGISAALLWCGAFAFACSIFFAANKLLRGVPPTPAVAIGRVTIDGVSKLRDYLGGALFYLIVPALTVLFASAGRRLHAWTVRPLHRRGAQADVATIALFALPFFLAPFFFLTTRKELWGILLPPLLAVAAVRAMVMVRTRMALRELFAAPRRPYHWLLIFEALAWLLFRYLATGKRIAHIPTLFLEVIFALFFIVVFWTAVLLIARLTALLYGRDAGEVFANFAVGAAPLLLLPFLGLTPISAGLIIAVMYPMTAATIVIAIWKRFQWTSEKVWRMVAFAAAPALLFCVSYASNARLSPWIDLFHRGESLGPASDYLRGKVPYRDVFVLHGMLENGLLDSWLMRLFGRHVDVALTRLVVIAALTAPMLWLISIVILKSISLALLASLLTYVISTDNQRAFPQMLVALLLIGGVKRRSALAITLSGAFAGFAVFYGLDMGIYSVTGGLVALALLAWRAGSAWKWLLWFLVGVLAGAAPFVLYLAINGAAIEFLEVSFVTVPAIIDAVWSLPFPDPSRVFQDFSVRTLADFVLTERFRFILNPLILGIALTYIVVQLRRKNPVALIPPLIILVVFAVLTQRSALGRADFQHQYYSAILLPPILVVLAAGFGRFLMTLWEDAGYGERVLLGILVVVAIPVIGTVLWVPDLLNARLDATTQYRQRSNRVDRAGAQGEEITDRIRAIRHEVSQIARSDDPVFDFSNQPALYFFTNRPNPTRFYQVPILSPIDHQMEAIRNLATHRPPVVFRESPENYHVFDGIENDLRAPAVAAFLDDHYAFFRNVRGIELWRPIRWRARPISHYRSLFALPSNASLAPRQRLIFPSVGSVAGIASFWKSDLILHNPHTLATQLDLRYVAGSGARDRELVLAAGKTLQLTDFVSSFFAAPGTRGALWIEFPTDRRPLVRVATRDVSGNSPASIDPPLFETDAAAAGTALDELTIVGARAESTARVNIGVINVGSRLTHFRIIATDAAGQIIGAPVETFLHENQSYLLVDAGRELELPFHEPVVIHIRLATGKAIGYASVVSSSGTQHFIPAVPAHAR